MASTRPSPHIVEPRGDETHSLTVILLHGRDSDAREFADEFFESEASEATAPGGPRDLQSLFPTVRWVFASSGQLDSTRFGTSMNQWFDIWSVENPDERSEIQAPGLRQSFEQIDLILEQEERLIPRDKIVLGGISQGFATAIAYFLVYRPVLGGLVGFSSWLPFAQAILENIEEGVSRMLENSITPTRSVEPGADGIQKASVFLAHCTDDDAVVPLKEGQRLRDVLLKAGLKVEWHAYEDGDHWVNEPQEIDDLVVFLRSIVSATKP